MKKKARLEIFKDNMVYLYILLIYILNGLIKKIKLFDNNLVYVLIFKIIYLSDDEFYYETRY